MSHTDPLDDSSVWQRRERFIRTFESAWGQGVAPAIDDYLPSDAADRRAVLVELAHADLECRLKAGEAVQVESYLERYPDLAADPDIVFELIVAEMVLRRRAEPNLDLAAYLQRFPAHAEALSAHWGADSARTLAQADADSVPHPALPLVPGYEVLRFLARGGMGAVYQARQERLDRVVALKILAPEVAQRVVFAERFGREARALAKLNHPHIIAVHDFGEIDGLYYLVMEFVDGQDLRPLLRAGRLKPALALRLAGQVCDALQYAHEEGIIHRDVKPENILLDRKGRVKVADFGLAKLMPGAAAAAALTGSEQALGTLHYMAPEQLRRPLEVDQRADIYSLGVLLYEMLTGDLPLGRFAAPSQAAPVDPRLDAVVLRMLSRAPEDRFAGIAEVRAALDAISSEEAPAEGEGIIDAPAGPSSASAENGLPVRVFLEATGVFLLGWVATAAAANYGLLALIAAGALMLVLACVVTRRSVARLPELANELRTGRPRGNAPLALILGALGFGATVAGHFASWDRSPVDPTAFAGTYRGQETRLLEQLHGYEGKPLPRVVLATAHVSMPGEDKFALWMSISSVLLLLGASIVAVETTRFRNRWALHWQPALVLTVAFLLPLPLLHVVCGMLRNGSALDLSTEVEHMPNRQQSGAADLEHTTAAVERWAEANDYEVRLRGRWVLESLPDRKPVAQICWLEARSRSVFDRWRVTWSGVERRTPVLRIQCLCSEKPVESLVTVDVGSMQKGFQAPKHWDGLVDDLLATLKRAE